MPQPLSRLLQYALLPERPHPNQQAPALGTQEHNGARPPLQQRLYVAAVVAVPALLGCLLLYALLHHRPDPYWEETLGKHRGGVGFRSGFRDPAATAALRLLFVGNSFVHRNEGAETVRARTKPEP